MENTSSTEVPDFINVDRSCDKLTQDETLSLVEEILKDKLNFNKAKDDSQRVVDLYNEGKRITSEYVVTSPDSFIVTEERLTEIKEYLLNMEEKVLNPDNLPDSISRIETLDIEQVENQYGSDVAETCRKTIEDSKSRSTTRMTHPVKITSPDNNPNFTEEFVSFQDPSISTLISEVKEIKEMLEQIRYQVSSLIAKQNTKLDQLFPYPPSNSITPPPFPNYPRHPDYPKTTYLPHHPFPPQNGFGLKNSNSWPLSYESELTSDGSKNVDINSLENSPKSDSIKEQGVFNISKSTGDDITNEYSIGVDPVKNPINFSDITTVKIPSEGIYDPVFTKIEDSENSFVGWKMEGKIFSNDFKITPENMEQARNIVSNTDLSKADLPPTV